LVKIQEERWMEARLREQVEKAASHSLPKAQVRETLEALNWSAADTGRTFACKNAWCKTSTRDTNIWGFVLGALLGNLPVAQWEWAWYPLAYPEDRMQQCPRGCAEPESQAHFFSCPVGLAERRTTRQAERLAEQEEEPAEGRTVEERWASQRIEERQ
ncbi:hypothetical protein LPJ62_004161, partial [Coemansia sp. RSA 2167]